MSRAFDTIDRKRLMEILKDDVGLDDDELLMCRILLAETSLRVRLGETLSKVFYLNILGSPQGCSASPIFFIVLLNKALADLTQKFPIPRPAVDSGLPNDVEFADDVDILSFDKGYQKRILPYAEQVFGKTIN